MLRFLVGQAGFPGRYPVQANPLAYGARQAQSWLTEHGYLTAELAPTAKGIETALELGSDHRARTTRAQVGSRRTRSVLRGVYGTRVWCSCGWGGWPRPDRLRPDNWVTVPLLPAEGGRVKALQLHAEHCNEELD